MLVLRRPIPLLLACYALCAGISVLATGYGTGVNNQVIQMPLVDILQNSGLYPNDAFVATLRDYPMILWQGVARLGRVISMEYILLFGFVLIRMLMVAAAWGMASVLVPGSRLAPLFAMALFAMAPRPIIGAGTIMSSIFEQTGLAMSVYLMAMIAFILHRRFAWALLITLGIYLNIMYGVFIVVYLLLFAIMERTHFANWRRWVTPSLLVLLLVSPLALYTLRSMQPAEYDLNAWLQVNLIRAPHHMDPLAWRAEQWLRLAILLGGCLFAATRCRGDKPVLSRLMASASIAGIFWVILAFIARFSRSPSFLTLHSARGTDLFYCMGGVALVSLAASKMEQKPGVRPGLLLVPVMLASLFRPWYSPAIPALFFGSAAVAILLRRVHFPKMRRLPAASLPALLMAIALLWGVFEMTQRHWEIQIPHGREVERMAKWARESTPVNAVFLIDPKWDEFRPLAQRSVYITWKDGCALHWSRPFARIWLDRFGALGIHLVEMKEARNHIDRLLTRSYERLDDEAVMRISRDQMPINYWIVTKSHPTAFKAVFQGRQSKILEVREPAAKKAEAYFVLSFER